MFLPTTHSPDFKDASLDNAKRELSEAFDQFWETPGSLPQQLFHYCSADGLHGILTGRKLWLSDVFTLNDASEIEYAVDVVNRVLGRQNHRPPRLPSCLSPSLLRENLPLYVACFCSHGDLLSQWRGYTTAGSGFAVGFNRERLEQHCAKNSFSSPFPVIYGGILQTRAVERAIQAVVKHNLPETSCADLKKEFINFLSGWLLRIKNPCFTEEKEWRILRIRPEGPDLKFRAARGVIIPYIELSNIPPDVFASVTLGPAVDPKFGAKPVDLFLKHNQLDHVDLRLSKVPLRTLRY
jgi:hypothetical protein